MNRSLEAEKDLLTAILVRALLDLIPGRKNAEDDQPHHINARKWLLSNDSRPWTYLWICSQLHFTDAMIEKVRSLVHSPTGRRTILALRRTTPSRTKSRADSTYSRAKTSCA